MEIFIPDDMKRNVQRVAQFTDAFVVQFKSNLENIVPVGYTFKVEDSKHIYVYRTPEDKNDLRWSFKLQRLITNYGKNIVIEEDATAEDVYKLCGLLQLLSEVDVTLIGNVSISK